MQVIKIHHPFDPELIPAGPVVLAMGFFDGIHRGHQAVIKTARRIADEKGLPLAVLTYDRLSAVSSWRRALSNATAAQIGFAKAAGSRSRLSG